MIVIDYQCDSPLYVSFEAEEGAILSRDLLLLHLSVVDGLLLNGDDR